MNNVEWLIGQYRSEHDKRIGLQCEVTSLTRTNDRLTLEVANLRAALVTIRDAGKGDNKSELGWAADVADKALQ